MKKILFICTRNVYTTTTLLQVGFVIISSSIIPVVHVMLVTLRAIKTAHSKSISNADRLLWKPGEVHVACQVCVFLS